MASKVNTKLIIFIVVALVLATGIIGVLYVLNPSHNAGRNSRIGDEARDAGDLEKARGYYGRAVRQEPGNMTYLDKLEKVVLQMRPTTADHAVELYKNRLGILSDAARYNSHDPAAHLRFIHELVRNARTTAYSYQWEMVHTAASDMVDALPDDEPQKNLGIIYKTWATYRLATQRTPDELAEAQRELLQVTKSNPDNDLAWATLILGQRNELDKLRQEGRSPDSILQQAKLIDQTLDQALQAVPNGPEVARVQLMHLLVMHSIDPQIVAASQLRQSADRLLSLITTSADAGYVSEVIEPLWVVPGDGFTRAVNLLTQRIQAHPDELDMRMGLARLNYMRNDLEGCETHARLLLDAPPLTASFMAQLQFDLRKFAAALIVDAQHRRWMQAPDNEKATSLKAIEDARAKLAEYITDPENDSLALQADGKIAFAKGEFNKAAQAFERMLKDPTSVTLTNGNEIMLLSAVALRRIGQVGLAYERMLMALERSPQNPIFLAEKARMEAALGRYKEAAATLKTLPASEFEKDEVRLLVEQINANAGTGAPIAMQSDPAITALANANAAIQRGDFDTARTTLLTALQATPENFTLLQRMIELEGTSGNAERAQEYLARAKALRPDDLDLKRIETLLKYTDPIEAMRELNKLVQGNETVRTESMVANLMAMHHGQESFANRLEVTGDAAGAAKARELAARAKTEAATYATQLEQLAPDNVQLLEYRFNDALMAKDWPRAEACVARGKALNADEADGAFYRGRYELLKGNTAEAIRNLEAATDRLGFSAQAWRTLGLAYETLPNYSQAQRAYEQAYKCNPNDLDSIRRYVGVLKRAAQQERALGILRKVHEVAPDDADLRDQWLEMEAQRGDKVLALRTRTKMYATNPSDRQNGFRLAALLGELEPTRELILDNEGNPTVSENRWTRLTTEEKDQIIRQAKTDWYKASDSILDGLATTSKDELSLAVLRAALLRERGEVVEGEKVLQELIGRTDPSAITSAMLLELGRYQARTNHFTEAIATFEEALKYQDPKKREVDMEIGLLYVQRLGMPAKALEHLKAVQVVAPDRGIQSVIVECLYKLAKFDEAERRLAEIISSSGEDYVTSMLAAGIAEGRGNELWVKGNNAEAMRKYEQQREALGRAESQQPSSPTPRILLAQSFLNEFGRTRKVTLLDDALQSLERAERINAGVADVSMMRVAVLKAKGDRNAAAGELERLLASAPDDVQARRELISVYAISGNFDNALKLVSDAIKRNPTMALWYETEGDLYKMMKQKKVAKTIDPMAMVSAYAKAYDASPTPAMMMKYAEASLTAVPPDCKGVVDRIEARPKDLADQPPIKELYARALVCVGRRDEALSAAREAYAHRKRLINAGTESPAEIMRWFAVLPALFPAPSHDDVLGTHQALADAEKFVIENCGGSPDPHEYRSLATMWLFIGDPKLEESIKRIRKAIDLCPQSDNRLVVDLRMELANFLLLSQDFRGALVEYQAVLQKDPRHVAALNNMAFLMAENLKDPSGALTYAEQALKLAPLDASIMDTVGWVHFLKGDNEKARKFFDQSIAKENSAPTRAHLAEMLLEAGDLNGAQLQLDEASKLSPDIQTLQKMSTLQDDIKKQRTSGK